MPPGVTSDGFLEENFETHIQYDSQLCTVQNSESLFLALAAMDPEVCAKFGHLDITLHAI